ncbi:MAG: hypothetical protein U9O96_08635 [Candidatus Thermoplasmatota archaeon]|nr:hypothetical protein [Candidatus Thermoplasmatota archaeon]
MKGKWKIFSVIGAIFILASVGTLVPTVAGEQTTSVSKATLSNESKVTPELTIATLSEQEKRNITQAMSKYTEKTADGRLRVTIGDTSKISLSEEEFELYKQGIEGMNELVSSGAIEVVKTPSGEYVGKPIGIAKPAEIPKTYSEYVASVGKLNIPQEQKEQLLSITEEEWNGLIEKLEGGAIGALGGKNGGKISWHWYGIKYEIWLDHYWTGILCDFGAAGVAVVALILSIITGGWTWPLLLGIAAIIIAMGLDYIEDEVDQGNGVKFTFKDYWWNGIGPIDYANVEPQ